MATITIVNKNTSEINFVHVINCIVMNNVMCLEDAVALRMKFLNGDDIVLEAPDESAGVLSRQLRVLNCTLA